ncbi:MAG: proton-conducting transporter membrane subunit [Bacteroidota bacterium]
MYTSIIHSALDNWTSWSWILPGLILTATLLILLGVDVLLPDRYRLWGIHLVPTVGICLALYVTIGFSSNHQVQAGRYLANHMLVMDLWSVFWHRLLLSVTGITLLVEAIYPTAIDRALHRTLFISTLLGAYGLIMASHGLTIYLSLALITVAYTTIIYVACPQKPTCTLASLQYILYSIVVSMMMLWGLSYWYGVTGSFSLDVSDITLGAIPRHTIWIGCFLALSGLFLVMGIFPFHYWLVDVYQTLPPQLVAHMATVPKLAAVACIVRWYGYLASQLHSIHTQLQDTLSILALLTISLGHITALTQKQPRRIWAYGSIVQGGFLLAGLAAGVQHYASIAYYGVVYAVTTLSSWVGFRMLQARDGEHVADYVGLGRQYPDVGLHFLVAVFSLVGLPPTGGFPAKFFIFSALWEALQTTRSPLVAVLCGVSWGGSVVAMYYYFPFIYALFSNPTRKKCTVEASIPLAARMLLFLLSMTLLGLFVGAGKYRDWLVTYAPVVSGRHAVR